MAVYSTMIRGDDPAARARMRVTPEVILNLPRYHCLASWIVDGQRASSFILQTKPMEDRRHLGWNTIHLQAQQAQVGEYPEQMAGTLRRKLNAGAPRASGDAEPAVTLDAEHADGGERDRRRPPHQKPWPRPAASARRSGGPEHRRRARGQAGPRHLRARRGHRAGLKRGPRALRPAHHRHSRAGPTAS